MAGCGQTGCGCTVEVGDGLRISGSGSVSNPYLIELGEGDGATFIAESSPTVNLSLNGNGTPNNPFFLYAQATVRVQDLTDVTDPEGSPAIGDTLVFVDPGGGVEPRWEMRAPLPNPAGAVNAGNGIVGDGSLATPLSLALLGTSAGGPTTGLEVYLDSASKLRAVAPVVTAVSWGSITGKPATFPTTPADFTGTLPVNKGGTGQTNLDNVTVGNADRIGNRKIYVQSSEPIETGGVPINSLWFW